MTTHMTITKPAKLVLGRSPFYSAMAMGQKFIADVCRWHRNRKARHHMAMVNDHTLRDIGLSRLDFLCPLPKAPIGEWFEAISNLKRKDISC